MDQAALEAHRAAPHFAEAGRRRPLPEDERAQRREPDRSRLSRPGRARAFCIQQIMFTCRLSTRGDFLLTPALSAGYYPVRSCCVVFSIPVPARAAHAAAVRHDRASGTGAAYARRPTNSMIAQLEEQWRQAQRTNDAATIDRLLSDDYIGISAQGMVSTKAAGCNAHADAGRSSSTIGRARPEDRHPWRHGRRDLGGGYRLHQQRHASRLRMFTTGCATRASICTTPPAHGGS